MTMASVTAAHIQVMCSMQDLSGAALLLLSVYAHRIVFVFCFFVNRTYFVKMASLTISTVFLQQ